MTIAMLRTPQGELRDAVPEVCKRADIRPGSPLPLGTQEYGGGVNFAVFSRHATRVRLELFDDAGDVAPARVVDLDSARNRTGDVWHVWVKGIGPGQLYAYRVDGPYEPSEGRRFNFNRLLLDPLATAISRLPAWDFASARGYDPSAPERDLALSKLNNSRPMPKCVFANEPFEWDRDQPLRHPWSKTVEGETTNAEIETLRKRQIKNFLLILLISRGVPMLLGGDEFRRTQGGNNNAYCQDNETSWVDWEDLERQQETYRFVRGMIVFRQAHPVLSREQFYTDAVIHWFDPRGGLPNWADANAKQFACLIEEDEERALYLMFNAGTGAVEFGLPLVPPGALWHLAVDTFREAPQDMSVAGEEPLWEDSRTYRVGPRSSAILLFRRTAVE